MDRYRYALELIGGDGHTLCQLPVDPDWEPAIECAAFSAARRGALTAGVGTPGGMVEPQWDEARGQPYVSGFRVCIEGLEPETLPLTYVWPQARAAATSLIAARALATGDAFQFRVHAFLAPDDSPAAADPSFAVEAAESALPVDEHALAPLLAHAARSGPSAEADEFPVFVSRVVLDEAAARARAHPDVEVGGILLGRLCRDPSVPEMFLIVTAQIPARHTVSNATSLTFTAETWAAVDAAIVLRGGRELRCGWHHSHPNWCRQCPLENQRRCMRSNAFFSDEDLHLHSVCFGRGGFNVALLTAENIRTGMTWSLYGWRRGVVAERGFHVIE